MSENDCEWVYPDDRDINDALRIVDLMHESDKPGYFVLSDELKKIRTEVADEARRGAARRAVKHIDDLAFSYAEAGIETAATVCERISRDIKSILGTSGGEDAGK